jgi:hypothetical protein
VREHETIPYVVDMAAWGQRDRPAIEPLPGRQRSQPQTEDRQRRDQSHPLEQPPLSSQSSHADSLQPWQPSSNRPNAASPRAIHSESAASRKIDHGGLKERNQERDRKPVTRQADSTRLPPFRALILSWFRDPGLLVDQRPRGRHRPLCDDNTGFGRARRETGGNRVNRESNLRLPRHLVLAHSHTRRERKDGISCLWVSPEPRQVGSFFLAFLAVQQQLGAGHLLHRDLLLTP